jgi:tRNA modification GTPase
MSVDTQDTIVAISTPPGRGGIGIVRFSGPEGLSVAQQLLALKQPLQHAQARFTRILDEADTTIDEAIVTAFFAPNSYTGEDLVEIAAHGSPVVLDFIVRRALSLGARIAEPGEFSRRAFLAGRLDLTQAEAIHDLIAAQTLAQARTAAQQLGGALSRRIAPIKLHLVHLIAMLEAGMDFATGELDDVDTMPPSRIAAGITAVQEPLAALAASFRFGSIQRNGIKLAMVGRPNAGKSSLFNRLLERDRAIVTATPGTTRDTIEETFSLDGIPVQLIDTAGLRGSQSGNIDEAEALGIARSREALAEADLILLVQDATSDEIVMLNGVEDPLLDLENRPILRVRNKIDLVARIDDAPDEISTSALTGAGLDELRAAILSHLRTGSAGAEEGALNNLRQHAAVTAALTALGAAELANGNHLPHELLLVDLHATLAALDTLTGVTTTDDILALIFSTFCIGK